MGMVKRYVRRRCDSGAEKIMIIINNINLPLSTDFSDLSGVAAKELKTNASNIVKAELYRRSVDARKKNDVHFCCSVLVEVRAREKEIASRAAKASIFEIKPYVWKKVCYSPENRPVIAGFGPAGMFAALTLARAGLCPIVLERGADVDTRTKMVAEFFSGKPLDTETNVQFGEGGAGTFSDGKLNTGIKNPRSRTVLEVLNAHGAPDRILTDAKPHIGTDILVNVVKSIREEIISLGGEVRFSTRLDDISVKNGRIVSVSAGGREIPCDSLILATGHSARDTFSMLYSKGLKMVRKPFAMGVRIEHLQSDINKALYGEFHNSPYLGAADYKLAVHLENGRGVYTFCMCPGGEVINASSEAGGIAVNGMSYSRRSGRNANSALLVNVDPSDFAGDDIFAGCELQRNIERAAYNIGGPAVPVTTVGNFVFGDEFNLGKVIPTVKPKFVPCEMEKIFPSFITESLKAGILSFDKKISGFADRSAVITAPETRSSSPIRILRDENLQSVSVRGMFPCGEGAGYAGGIVSAAVDGISVAEKLIDFTSNKDL